MAFTRTPAGLAMKWRFYTIPTVWVEGPTDILFYEPMLDMKNCRFEAFYGLTNADALVNALNEHDYPYLVVLDGDYGILKRKRSPHRRVVVLNRYSIENYLWEYEAVNQACLRHAQCGDIKDLVISKMKSFEKHLLTELLHAIILDVAIRRQEDQICILPERIEPLLRNSKSAAINPQKIAPLLEEGNRHVDNNVSTAVGKEIQKYLQTNSIMNLLKGHMVLGALRIIFMNAAKRERKGNSNVTNDALMQLLSEMIWRRIASEDHRKLRHKIWKCMREATLMLSRMVKQ